MLLKENAPIEQSPLALVDIPIPSPRKHELLVKIKACAICRTDLHVIERDLIPKKLPIIPGHQIIGVVEELGESCKKFKIGDRVGIAWLRHTCGSCSFCSAHNENLCDESRYTGYHEHGGFAEYTVVPEDFAYAIPQVFTDVEAAPLLCAGIIGYRAFKRSNIPPNGKLALYGFGSSAHITIQLARHQNCAVFVATRGEAHKQMARDMGATWVGSSHEEIPTKVDSAIVFAPVGKIAAIALKNVRKGGTVAIAGIYMSQIPPLDYDQHLFHEKNLCSVESNTRLDGQELLAIAATIPIRPRITRFKLEETNEALKRLKKDGLEGTGVLEIP